MSKIKEIRLDEETTFFVQVVDDEDEVEWLDSSTEQEESGGLIRAGRREESLTKRVSVSMTDALTAVYPVIEKVVEKFRAIDPSECRVSFGLKVHGNVGVVLVSEVGVEAQLKVTLRWRKPKAKKQKTS
ncbi:MAG: hypothetical protein HQL07_00165 [Nitrospirae bacterium]|nr:hypothetical protein [Magnetococcales bacterium]HAT49649.1 hypothetical protein [Alphaproteobacteria bacterium]